jgi:hypothetical protein
MASPLTAPLSSTLGRITRTAMFEPQKLITVALAVALLAPFGFVFWRIAIYQHRPEAEVRAQLEAQLEA